MALLWGLGLGLTDAAFFGLVRESYTAWTRLSSPNSTGKDSVRVWSLLGAAGVAGGVVSPLLYLWAAYSLETLVEAHLYRCIVSILLSLVLGSVLFKDTINGLQGLGVLFSMVGLLLVLNSSAFAKN
jgi:drug/metabolite transporter (DMT)-like permease